MAKKGEPKYEIDWTSWAALDRNSMQMGASSTAMHEDLQQALLEGEFIVFTRAWFIRRTTWLVIFDTLYEDRVQVPTMAWTPQ